MAVRPEFEKLARKRDSLSPYERGQWRALNRALDPDERALLAELDGEAVPDDGDGKATPYARGLSRGNRDRP